MKLLVLTSQPYMGFVFKQVSKLLPTSEFTISVRKNPNFDDYEIGISFMYLYKVPKEQVEKHTWINFHPAPLPEYKGRNLCYHAIMNEEEQFGTTVHYMDENFDAGDIIDCFRFYILDDDTSEKLSEFTINQCKAQFRVYLPDIVSGKQFERHPNKECGYYKKSVILDTLEIAHNSSIDKFVRAVTYKEFIPRLIIGGELYKVVKDE